MSEHLVYLAEFEDGSVYVGRTSCGLKTRISWHRRSAQKPRTEMARKLATGMPARWVVLVRCRSRKHSKGAEIGFIAKMRGKGLVVLNRTRGGWYDHRPWKLGERGRGRGGGAGAPSGGRDG